MTTQISSDHARRAIDESPVTVLSDDRVVPTSPPIVHPIPGRVSFALATGATVVTVLSWLAYVVHTIRINATVADARTMTLVVVALLSVSALAFSALNYLVARRGALVRFREHQRVPRGELDEHFARHPGSMTVLVPSYAEEPRVVRSTLWSAVLQEFPNLRVVLLLDDPPWPLDGDVAARLAATRNLAIEVESELAVPRAWFEAALESFNEADGLPTTSDVLILAEVYDDAVGWLERMAAHERRDDHTEHFFVNEVILGLATELRQTASALRATATAGELPSSRRLRQLYTRLVHIFSADVSVFERKKYLSLSHEANKAMNLNSYISLMGGEWMEEAVPGGVVLRPALPGYEPDLVVPDTDYVLTLDADSMLLREYCVRLVHHLEQPGNERIAIAQTPYCAYPGAPTSLERMAGATTDLQHIQHQGKSHFGATYWVGANAVIRRQALKDIAQVHTEGGFPVRTYIQDRTVIEDTESSVDLRALGWTLINYPERLSFSATPPDFGSLVVQRRRWANGGLIILPKLLATAWRGLRSGNRMPFGEFILRLDYLGSITWGTLGLVILLVLPDAASVLSPLALLTAVPYFAAMASDLHYSGHRRRDVLWIYGLNMVMLPVNAAGVLKSLEQAVRHRKIPFQRTPKVRDRTAAPALFVLLPYAVVGAFLFAVIEHSTQGTWGGLAFASVSGALTLVGALAFIGVRDTLEDVRLGVSDRARTVKAALSGRVAQQDSPSSLSRPAADGAAYLYFGEFHEAVTAPAIIGTDIVSDGASQ
ncbi:MAG: glycosyltransferase family 2 protein [Propionibacteriaceae bacterium]|nr:glycosyltransferase family 2 protein [Propionibacteriaceae bacterium]